MTEMMFDPNWLDKMPSPVNNPDAMIKWGDEYLNNVMRGTMPYNPRVVRAIENTFLGGLPPTNRFGRSSGPAYSLLSRGKNPILDELENSVKTAADRAAEIRALEANQNAILNSQWNKPWVRDAALRSTGRFLGTAIPVLGQLDLAYTLGSGLYHRLKNFNDLRELAPTEPEPNGY